MRFQECVGISLTVAAVTLALATRVEAQGNRPTINVQVVSTGEPFQFGIALTQSPPDTDFPVPAGKRAIVEYASHSIGHAPLCSVTLSITTIGGGVVGTHRLQEIVTDGPTRSATQAGQVVRFYGDPETHITFSVGVAGTDCDVAGAATISGVLVDVP